MATAATTKTASYDDDDDDDNDSDIDYSILEAFEEPTLELTTSFTIDEKYFLDY